MFESKVLRRIFRCKLVETTVSCTKFHSNVYLHQILVWLYKGLGVVMQHICDRREIYTQLQLRLLLFLGILALENENSILPWNIRIWLSIITASYPRRIEFSGVQTSKPETTFFGRLKGRDIFKVMDVDGWVIMCIRIGFKGNASYVWKVWRLTV